MPRPHRPGEIGLVVTGRAGADLHRPLPDGHAQEPGGVELRIVDDQGNELPWDGESVGEIQVRGPWITGSYYGDGSGEKFDRGWLRT